MPILTVCQSLSAIIGIERPSAVMASQDREHFELGQLANEVGKQIAEVYTWQGLKRLATITGDGSTKAFDLPADFGWIPSGQNMATTEGVTPYVRDHDEWLRMELSATASVDNRWTVLGDEILFGTPPTLNAEYKFYYQSKHWARNSVGDLQESFTADEDSFRLDEQLLKLGMLWKWRGYKGLPYAEQLADFGEELRRRVFYDRPRLGFVFGRYGSLIASASGSLSFSGGGGGDGGGSITFAFPYTLPFPVA